MAYKKTRNSNLPDKPGPGRPKGSLNKNTVTLKDAILLAAQQAGGGDKDGLAKYLKSQALANPGPFMALLGKVLPMQIAGDPDNPVRVVGKVQIEIVDGKPQSSAGV